MITHRQRQALATRRAIAAAARRLFAERGYVSTTVEAISAAADIPVQTIYSALGSKRAILEEIRLEWTAETNVAALHARALTLADPSRRLAAAAHWTRRQFELGHEVVRAYQEAARVDEEAATAWRRALDGREAAVGALLASMKGSLRRGLTLRTAVDVYVALTVPEMYRELVIARRWTPARYERWLAQALRDALLEARPPRPGGQAGAHRLATSTARG